MEKIKNQKKIEGRSGAHADLRTSTGWRRPGGLTGAGAARPPLSINIGQGQTVTLTQSKSGPPITDTLRGSPLETP